MVIIDFFKGLFDKAINVTAFQCLYILMIACGVVLIYCFVAVLIKAYQEKGLATLLMGIFIPFFAFIWGWVHHRDLENKNTMTTWTTTIIILLVLYGMQLITTTV